MKVKVKTAFIKQLRKEQNWTQEQLAEQANVHARTVQRMEAEGMVSSKTLHAVAKCLNIEAYRLEFATDEIDFAPVLNELRILLLAITRRLIPKDDRDLPNNLVAVLTLLSFSASYTLFNGIMTIVQQPQKNFDSLATSGLLGLVLAFCLLYAGVVYPLFKLKPWARLTMIGICYVFFAINVGLFVSQLHSSAPIQFGALTEYGFNLLIVYWIYRILNQTEVKQLYRPLTATPSGPKPPPDS